MANYDSCINFVIGLEDSHPSGQVTHDSDGATRYGLLDRWHPDLVQAGLYTLPPAQALPLATACYRAQYWNYIQGDNITSNVVAAQLLSIAVNDGVGTATKMAQATVGLTADGVLGPHTLAAINSMDPNSFISHFSAAARAHYNAIVAMNPAKAGDLNGWYNRINAIQTFQG